MQRNLPISAWTWFRDHNHRDEILLVAGFSVVAFVIRLIGIDQQSLWTDEGYSLWFSRQPIAELWGPISRNEFNPTLYYILLNLWTDVFGESVMALRSLSAFLNALSLPFVYMAARWAVSGPRSQMVAVLSAILFSLALEELIFSQEARTYCLCVLATAMVAAASTRIVRGTVSFETSGETLPIWPFVLLGTGAALAMWGHFTSAIPLAMMGLFHAGLLAIYWQRRENLLRNYLIAGGVFFLLAGRALWLFVAYALPSSGDFWITAPGFLDLIDATTIIFGGSLALESWGMDILARTILFSPWPLLGLYGAWRAGDSITRVNLLFLLTMSALTFAAFLIISYLGKPVFLQRIVLPVQVGWIILCAMSILVFDTVKLRRVAAALLVGVFAVSTMRYFASMDSVAPKEPWNEAAAMLAREAAPGETIHVSSNGEVILSYYLGRMGRTDLDIRPIGGYLRTPPARPAFSSAEIRYSDKIDENRVASLASALADREPAWMVVRNPQGNQWNAVHEVLSIYDVRSMILQPGPIGIYRIGGPAPSGMTLAEEHP